jgi:hypothetical protein
MGYNVDDKIYTFDDLGKVAPRVSYSPKLKKIVLENYEAFWLLLHATKHPDIINGVCFETDDEFKKYYVKSTDDNNFSPYKLNKFILKEMMQALEISDQRDDFQGTFSDQSERLYITNPDNHENLQDLKIMQSKSSSQNQTKYDIESKSKNYKDEDRMDIENYKKWSEEEMSKLESNRGGNKDGETQ